MCDQNELSSAVFFFFIRTAYSEHKELLILDAGSHQPHPNHPENVEAVLISDQCRECGTVVSSVICVMIYNK